MYSLMLQRTLTLSLRVFSMEKFTFNNEQLEFLKFMVQDFEYNDDHEKYMIEQIENKIYQAQENQALKLLSGMN